MTVSVRVNDRGARALVARLRPRAGATFVDVGVLGVDGAKPEGDSESVTVADVARWAELGLGQPQRRWLGGFIDEHRDALLERIRIETRAIIAGERTREQALARLGLWIVGGIQQRIANGIAPENAESTIERKGSSTPLIDKGQFRSSISSRVGGP